MREVDDTAAFSLRSRRLIGLTVVMLAFDIALSIVVYGWDMRSGLDSPGEWESDEWLSAVGALWIFPLVFLLVRTWRVYAETRRATAAMALELHERRAQEEGREVLLAAQRQRILELIDGRAIEPFFQPIVQLDGERQTVGFEALARFPTGTAQAWFRSAAEAGLTVELELEAIRRALERVAELPSDVYVSLNASPATLDASEFFSMFRDLEAEQVVVEITENLVVDDYERTNRILSSLRRLGVRLAVDDAGAGYASLRHIVNLAPEFIKLDRSLIQNLDTDPARRALTRAITSFAGEMRVTVIAEGVETEEELATLKVLGVPCAQGYLLGRPSPADVWHP